MTIIQLEYLVALSHLKNYSKAAIHCNVTQPTLSMQLRKLEDSFGEPLIKRGKSPVEFTLLGNNVVKQAKIVLQEFENLNQIQGQSNESFNMEITIGIIPTIATYMIPKIAKHVQNLMQGCVINFVELKTEDLIAGVNEMDVDYGIISGPYNGYLKVNELFLEPIMVYADRKEKEIELNELKNEKPWLLTKGNCFRMQMIRLCNNNETETSIPINFEGESLVTIVNMVDSVGGYTMVPKYYIDSISHDDEKLKKIRSLNPVRSIIGISRKRNAKSDYLKMINVIIKEEFSKKIQSPLIIDWH